MSFDSIKIGKCLHIAQSITKLLQCSICLEVFSDPVSIGCAHFFCRNCIGTVLRTQTEAVCPICKKSFTRRHIQEACQRQKIVAATKGLVSAIENIAGNTDSGKKKSKSPPSHSPGVLLSSDSVNHSSARNVKKAKFTASKSLESIEITNETKHGMVSYFTRKGGSATEEVQTPKVPIDDEKNFETKFYDRSKCTPTPKGISKALVSAYSKVEDEELKLAQKEKPIQSKNFVSIDNCTAKRKPSSLEKVKKKVGPLRKENKVESKDHDPYDFEEDRNSLCNDPKTNSSSSGKKAKRSNQQTFSTRQNLKRYICSPMLSKKKRKIVCNKVEMNNTAKEDITKKKQNRPDILNKKNDGSSIEENNSNAMQENPAKSVDEMETNACDLKLRENDEQNGETVKEILDCSIHVGDEQVTENLPGGDKNISLNLENDVQNIKSIGSLLSRTTSLKSCQQLISSKKSLLERNNNIKENEVMNDSKDIGHPHVTEPCNEDTVSAETVVVLPVTSPEDQADDRDFMLRSAGWSRIKQMNKDFHLRKFSLLQVQKNKNVHLPNVSVCDGPNESLHCKEHFDVSGEPIPCEDAESTGKKENILSSRDQTVSNKTDNVTNDVQYEKPLSDTTSPYKSALKKLNFDHSKITNDNEVSMDFGNTAPFDINDDMDVDAVFSDNDDTVDGREILAANDTLSPVVTRHSSLLVPEEPSFEFTKIGEVRNSSEIEGIHKLKNDKLSCNFVLESLEKALISNNSSLKFQSRKKSAELLFTPEHARQSHNNSLLKELLSREESSETETASNNVSDRQQCPVLPTTDSGKETTDSNERKRSSSNHNAFTEHKLSSFLSEKSFEGSKSEKVIKRVCLTLDEICAYFNDNNASGITQNIASVPLPFTNYKLQLTVAEETLNISILKVLQNLSCENVNTSSNSSFQDLKPELSNVTVKEFKDAQTQYEPCSIDTHTQCDTHNIDAQTCYKIPSTDAQTQCQIHTVNVETQCRTDSVDVQIQCSSLIVSKVMEEDSQMNLSMETLPETQPWTDSKKEERDHCEDWLNESIVTDSNIEMPILPEQILRKISVCEAETNDREKSYLKKCGKDSQVDAEKMANETLYISSSSIPSLHSMDIKSIECKSPLKIDICDEKNNSPTSIHSDKKSTDPSLVENDDCYRTEGNKTRRCSTPIRENGIPETHSETNGKMNPLSKNQVNVKSDVNFTSSEALFEATKLSNSKNTYSKASSLRKYEIELLKKEKLDQLTLKENAGRLSPVESCNLSENFDPFAESIDFCKKTPAEAEFDEILKESENYSSDPDMIFATNLVAPLKDIARKEKEIPLLATSKHSSSKCANFEKGGMDIDAPKFSQTGKQFKRISAYNDSDSSGSEELPQTRSLLKRRKRIKEKTFMRNVMKALKDDADLEENASLNLDNPQALARVYANINADLNCAQASPKRLDKPSVKEVCDVKCVFEAPLSYNDEEPSETASKLELELNEMEQEAERLRKQIFQEESMEEMNENDHTGAQKSEVGDISCNNEEQCDLSVSKENNDQFSEQIPPTPPKVEVIEKRTKFSSKIYKRI